MFVSESCEPGPLNAWSNDARYFDVEYTYGYVFNPATGLCLVIDQSHGFFDGTYSAGAARAPAQRGLVSGTAGSGAWPVVPGTLA